MSHKQEVQAYDQCNVVDTVEETVDANDGKVSLPRTSKKEETLHPRLKAKLDELQARGLLTSAKAYKCPTDVWKQFV